MKNRVMTAKFKERYKDNEILSNDIVDENLELIFFNNISMRIKEVRKDLQMTQAEFGESAGLDRRNIAKIESQSQRPSFKIIRSLSICHKISPDWLCYGTGDKYVKTDPDDYGNHLSIFQKLLDTGNKENIEIVIKMINQFLR